MMAMSWRPSWRLFVDDLSCFYVILAVLSPLLGIAIVEGLFLFVVLMAAFLAGAAVYFWLKARRSEYVLGPDKFHLHLWGVWSRHSAEIPVERIEGLEFGLGREGSRICFRLSGGETFTMLPRSGARKAEPILRSRILEGAREFGLPAGRVEEGALRRMRPFLDPDERVLFAIRTERFPKVEEVVGITNKRLLLLRRRGRGGFVKWHRLDRTGPVGRIRETRFRRDFSLWERSSWRCRFAALGPTPSPFWLLLFEELRGHNVAVGCPPFPSSLWVPGAPMFLPEEVGRILEGVLGA